MPSTLDRPASKSSGSHRNSAKSGWASKSELDEFNYVPLSPWGPVALALGLCSLSGLMNSVFGLVVAFCGIVAGIVAVIAIRSAGGAVKGSGMAFTGLIMSALCLVLGSVKLSHAYQTECPEGYTRVNFPKEISDRQFVYFGQNRRLHPEVAKLIGQPIFLKGFMWQTQAMEGLTEFVFLKDNGECCFGGKPQPYDMMVVTMEGEKTTRAYPGMVAVAGILHANVNAGENEPVYTITADMVEEAQTSF